jgi:hypothetical protein
MPLELGDGVRAPEDSVEFADADVGVIQRLPLTRRTRTPC